MKLRSGRVITARARTVPRRRVRPTRTTRVVQNIARRTARRELRRNKELKRHYRASGTATTNGTATVINQTVMGNCSTGDDIGNREGAQVLARSVHFRLFLQNLNTAIPAGWFRFLVVKRKHPEGGLDELFKPGSNAVDGSDYSATGDVMQITAPINEKRYTVLLDKRIRILPDNISSVGRSTLLKRYSIRLNKKLNFTTNTTTDADVTPNIHYFGFFQWDDSTVTNTIRYNCKTWTYFNEN